MFLHKINQRKRKKNCFKNINSTKILIPLPWCDCCSWLLFCQSWWWFPGTSFSSCTGSSLHWPYTSVIIPKTASSVVQGCSFTNGFKVICRWVTATRGNPILPPALPLPRDWAPPLMSAVALGGAHWACQGANLTKKRIFCLFGFQLIWAGSADQFLILFTTVSQRKWWKHAAMLKGKKG